MKLMNGSDSGAWSARRAVRGLAFLLAARVFGDSIEAVVLPWSVLTGLGSLLGAAGVLAAMGLPWIIIPVFAGALIDRASRRPWIARFMLLFQAALLLVLIALLARLGEAWALVAFYALVIALGFLDALIGYYVQVMVPAVVGYEPVALQEANGYIALWSRASRLIGFTVAALLVVASPQLGLALDAAALAYAALLHWVPGAAPTEQALAGLREQGGVKGERIPVILWLLIASTLLFNYAVGSWRIIVLDLVRGLGGYGGAAFSIANAMVVAAGVFGAAYVLGRAGRDYVEVFEEGCLLEALFIAALAIPYMAASPALGAVVAAVLPAVLGFADPLVNVSLDTAFQSKVPHESLGRVRGFFDTVAAAALTASELATAALLERVHLKLLVPSTYAVIAVAGALIGAYALRKG